MNRLDVVFVMFVIKIMYVYVGSSNFAEIES